MQVETACTPSLLRIYEEVDGCSTNVFYVTSQRRLLTSMSIYRLRKTVGLLELVDKAIGILTLGFVHRIDLALCAITSSSFAYLLFSSAQERGS